MIGVFGGTFDPPHIGHLILADEGRAVLGLERVLWVVTGHPPHKPEQPITPLEHRRAMVERAIDDNQHFQLSEADILRPGPHYSVGTLEWLRQRMPEAAFAYLMGSDSLRDLPTWHHPERLAALCDLFGVMRRPGAEVDLEVVASAVPGLREKVRFFDAPAVAVSAAEIRSRVARGAPYRYLVPHGVADVIEERGLYR